MIEMQYNFPLLPWLGEDWRARLRAAVEAMDAGDEAGLRPSFRHRAAEQCAVRDAGAQWLRTPAETTHVTEGGHHGTLLAMLSAHVAGRPVAVEALTYTGAIQQARALASPLVGCAFDAEGVTPRGLAEACERARRTGEPIVAAYLMATVQNPLGCTASRARREAIAEVAREQDLLLIEDDAYGFLEEQELPRYIDLAPERSFYVWSFSKCYAPAARTGFLVAPERFEEDVALAIKNTSTGYSAVHAGAAVSLLADGTLERVIAEKRAEGKRRNAAARAVLGLSAEAGCASAWHLWVKLPPEADTAAFQQRMWERQVLVSGGHGFTVADGVPKGLRIALGGELDSARMMMGVARLAEELGRSMDAGGRAG